VLVGAGVADAGGLVAVGISGVEVTATATMVGVLVGCVVPQAAGSRAVAATVTSIRIRIIRLPISPFHRGCTLTRSHPSPLLPNHHLSCFFWSPRVPGASPCPISRTADLGGRQYTRGSVEMQSGLARSRATAWIPRGLSQPNREPPSTCFRSSRGLESAARAALWRLSGVLQGGNGPYRSLQMPGTQHQTSSGESSGVVLMVGNTVNS
jgi:hypothetical protein